MALIGSIEAFDITKCSFESYEKRFGELCKVNVVEDTVKLSLFVTVCGPEIFELLVKLFIPEDPLKSTYAACILKLKDHFNPKKSKVLQRFKFNKCSQLVSQSISDYILDLRVLAKSCDFGTFLDEALRDRFIAGIKCASIQNILVEEDLTFEKACTKALAMELAVEGTKSLQCTDELQVNKIDKRKFGASTSSNNKKSYSKCFRCGRQHNPTRCPARNWSCFKCNKMGHGANVCKQELVVKPVRAVKKLKEVEDDEDDCLVCDVDEEDCMGYLNAIPGNQESGKNQKKVIKVSVNKMSIAFEVDTGACCTVMSKAQFRRLFGSRKMKFRQNLKTVTGQTVIVVGQFLVQVMLKNQLFNLNLVVIDSVEFTPLMGRDWINVLFPGWQNVFAVVPEDNVLSKINSDEIDRVSKKVIGEYKSKFPNIFSDANGKIKGYEADVVLKCDSKPIFCKSYTCAYAHQVEVERQLGKMVEEGTLFKVSHSKWASPIVVVPKQDGNIRICVDFKRTVNRVIDNEIYPLPNCDDIFASLKGGTYFTVLDLSGAYQQLAISDSCKELFTINTHLGLFRFNRLTYGISSAPAIFQKTMDCILKNCKNTQCYLDDVLITGSSFSDCVRNTETVLRKLSESNVRLNVHKSKFFQESVKYLGHIIGPNFIKPDPEKIAAIKLASIPKTVTELKSFMGLLNYYRKFAPMQATILDPLNNLTRKGVEFIWTSECQKAFEKCKCILSEKSLLVHFDPNKELHLTCDASSSGVGGVLSQKQDDREEPVLFASGTLSKTERNYSQLEKEALSIIYCLKKFSKFLLGRKFVIFTDHQPLTSLFNPRKGLSITAASRLQRWSIILSAYRYEIKYLKGKDNVVADALSRLCIKTKNGVDIATTLINTFKDTDKLPFNVEDIADQTKCDPLLSKVLDNIKRGWNSNISNVEFSPFYRRRGELSTEKGCILWGNRVVIPGNLCSDILGMLHSQHVGIVRMKQLARSFIWWPGMDKQIEEEAKTCPQCQKYQNRNPGDKDFIGWPKSDRCWYRVHGDFFHFNTKTYFLIVDSTSKWIDIFLMRQGTTADEVFDKLRSSFAVFGLPQQFVSDNGPPFNSSRFRQLLKCNGIEPLNSPVYYPQGNGQSERFVETVKNNFKKSLENQRFSACQLERHIQNYLFSYRTTPSTVTKQTPADMVLKQSPRTILSMLKPTFGDSNNCKVKITPKISFIFSANEKVLVHLNKNHWEEAVIVKPLSYNRYLVNHDNRFKEVHVQQMKRFYAKGIYSPNVESTKITPGVSTPAATVTPNTSINEATAPGTSTRPLHDATSSEADSSHINSSPVSESGGSDYYSPSSVDGSDGHTTTGESSSPGTPSEPNVRPARQRRPPERFRFSLYDRK